MLKKCLTFSALAFLPFVFGGAPVQASPEDTVCDWDGKGEPPADCNYYVNRAKTGVPEQQSTSGEEDDMDKNGLKHILDKLRPPSLDDDNNPMQHL